MATHPGMLIAYDADGNVIASVQYQTAIDPTTGAVLGLVDFAAMEEQGVPFRGSGAHVNVWEVPGAAGSAVWPQYLGPADIHRFRVELDERKRIRAIVHKPSGTRRTRDALERAIAERIERAAGQPADIADLVGGPDRPLEVTPTGAVRRRPDAVASAVIVRTGRATPPGDTGSARP